ncbi:MAG: TIR domain-containing protein [Clostridia bacterium]|nr:TIR domain-containing protein [Clostridia bacterium]
MSNYLGFDAVDCEKFYFASYNTEDKERVAKYAKELSEYVSVWYDYGIKAGCEWEKEINEHIKSCESLIIFITNNIFSKEDSYVRTEYDIAKFYKKPIYIVFLDEINESLFPTEYVAWWVKMCRLQGVKRSDYLDYKDCIKALVRDIGCENNSNSTENVRIIEYDDGIFNGEVVNEKKHGKGRYEFKNGDVYEGEFQNDKMHGYGKYVWMNGDVYEGEFQNGMRDGIGKTTYISGDVYEGRYQNGKKVK